MKFMASQWTPSAKQRSAPSRSLIDVSGLAGIMLALLFLMMFGWMYPMHPRSLPVDMAIAPHSTLQPGAKCDDAVTVGITRDGGLYVNNSRVSSADLPELWREAIRERGDKAIYVKADARAKYGDVKIVVDSIRSPNATHIVFLTERPPTP